MMQLPSEEIQKKALEHALQTSPLHDPSGPWLLIFAGIVILFSGFLNILALKFIFRYVLKKGVSELVSDDSRDEIDELKAELKKVKSQIARKKEPA